MGITAIIARRYGMLAIPPDAEERTHLAYLLAKVGGVFPFNVIQDAIAKAMSLFSPETTPGRSATGDSFGYFWAWYRRNPEVMKEIYRSEYNAGTIPHLPFLPPPEPDPYGFDGFEEQTADIPTKEELERMTNREFTAEEYAEYVNLNTVG